MHLHHNSREYYSQLEKRRVLYRKGIHILNSFIRKENDDD
jgi:hypothetical protein